MSRADEQDIVAGTSSLRHTDVGQPPTAGMRADANGSLTLSDMMVSPVDQLPRYAEPSAHGARSSTTRSSPTSPTSSSRLDDRDIKDPIYAPFLPSNMTMTSGDGSSTQLSCDSPSERDHLPPSSAGPSRIRTRAPLSVNTDIPSPMYSLSPPSATAKGGISVTTPLTPFTDVDIAEWKRGNGPYMEAFANLEDDGHIDVAIDVKGLNKPLPTIPASPLSTETGPVYAAHMRQTTVNGVQGGSDSSREEMESLAVASLAAPDSTDRKGKGKAKAWYADSVPVMNIVIFIVGSRGDVQPYIALALALITTHGHRVRIATHPDFRQFVLSANSRLVGQYHLGVPLEGRLEFFDAGGDPKSLMEYMVKSFESIKNGEIGKKQRMTADMLRGFYRSTFCPDIQSGREFAADAIISNPPAFAHIHVAEALGIPLHMSFTMPWTATTSFPHPLVNVSRSNADKSMTNWMGYGLADILMWQGLGGQINLFRTRDLRLEELPDLNASDILDKQRIPWTYCWSPELLPKPLDWKHHIDISGFYFLDGDDTYVPPPELREFLEAGEAPVYIGFGSVVIKDPAAMTDMLFAAIAQAGVRAIVSAGWAGLGKGKEATDPNILIWSKDVPHEWLFANDRVSAVMHHGGAGTTACGLRHGRPTIIVPFFGDQKFWGEAVHRAGAGPAPIPNKTVSVELFANALTAIKTEAMREAAGILGEKIRSERGEVAGVESFQRHLPMDDMRCDIDPRRIATMHCLRLSLRLSPEAAGTLLERGKILSHELQVYRTKEYETTRQYRDFLTSTGLAMNHVITTTVSGISQLTYRPLQGAITTFYKVPESMFSIIGDVYEGFQNMPGIMGSTVRHHKPVTGFISGLAEGGKALGWGIMDSVCGLVLDPIDGARREGLVGFGKGLGRGSANLIWRPSAGFLGFFVHPARGATQSVKKLFSGTNQPTRGVLLSPRLYLAKEAASRLPRAEKDNMIRRLVELERDIKKRDKARNSTKLFLLANRQEIEAEKALKLREKQDREHARAIERARRAEKEKRQSGDELFSAGEEVEGSGNAALDLATSRGGLNGGESSRRSSIATLSLVSSRLRGSNEAERGPMTQRQHEKEMKRQEKAAKLAKKLEDEEAKATKKAEDAAKREDRLAQKKDKAAKKEQQRAEKKERKAWEAEKKEMLRQEREKKHQVGACASVAEGPPNGAEGAPHGDEGQEKDERPSPVAHLGLDVQVGEQAPPALPARIESNTISFWRRGSALGIANGSDRSA